MTNDDYNRMHLLSVRLLHNLVLVQKSLVKLMPKYQKLKEGVMEEFVAVILSFLMNHRLLVAVLYVSYVLILFILQKQLNILENWHEYDMGTVCHSYCYMYFLLGATSLNLELTLDKNV